LVLVEYARSIKRCEQIQQAVRRSAAFLVARGS
jgi:hypothetical protein